MNPYKPQFFGSIAPFDDPVAMSDFLRNRFDAFSIIFDCIKEYAAKIESVTPVDTNSSSAASLSIAITTDGETLEKLKEKITSASIFGNVITATT